MFVERNDRALASVERRYSERSDTRTKLTPRSWEWSIPLAVVSLRGPGAWTFYTAMQSAVKINGRHSRRSDQRLGKCAEKRSYSYHRLWFSDSTFKFSVGTPMRFHAWQVIILRAMLYYYIIVNSKQTESCTGENRGGRPGPLPVLYVFCGLWRFFLFNPFAAMMVSLENGQ